MQHLQLQQQFYELLQGDDFFQEMMMEVEMNDEEMNEEDEQIQVEEIAEVVIVETQVGIMDNNGENFLKRSICSFFLYNFLQEVFFG